MISKWQDAMRACPKCGRKQSVDYRTHENDKGQHDVEFRCAACEKTWFASETDNRLSR